MLDGGIFLLMIKGLGVFCAVLVLIRFCVMMGSSTFTPMATNTPPRGWGCAAGKTHWSNEAFDELTGGRE